MRVRFYTNFPAGLASPCCHCGAHNIAASATSTINQSQFKTFLGGGQWWHGQPSDAMAIQVGKRQQNTATYTHRAHPTGPHTCMTGPLADRTHGKGGGGGAIHGIAFRGAVQRDGVDSVRPVNPHCRHV